MVEDQRPGPELFDAGASGRDAAAALARDDQQAQAAARHVQLLFPGNLAQVLRIRRRAAEGGNAVVENGLQPPHARHRSARKAETAQTLHRVQRGPKPKKWAEGKGKE